MAKEPLDIENLVLNASRAERQKIIDLAQASITDEEIEAAKKKAEKRIIENFMHKDVFPFDNTIQGGKAIYEVFNKKTRHETIMTGKMVKGYFTDYETFNSFEKKQLGTQIDIPYNGTAYRIRFKHYEIN